MEKVIARLKKEQQEDYQVGREAGAKDGTSWAREAGSLHDIRQIVDDDELDPDTLIKNLEESWCDRGYHDKIAERAQADYEAWKDGYTRGFREGVQQVYDTVKDSL